MRVLATLICLALICAAPAAAQGLEEAARLNAEVVKLFAEGKFEEALPLARRVVELREKTPGVPPKLAADARLNLAAVEQEAGRLKESGESYRRALSLYEKAGGDNAEQRAQALDGLARMEHDLLKAVSLRERGLELRERLYGADSPRVAPSVYSLAHLVEMSGRFDRAEKLFARFAAISEKAKPEGEETAVSHLRLACLLDKRKSAAEAEEYRARALKTFGAGGLVQKASLEADVKHKPAPGYPPEAMQKDIQGTVEVRVLVGENGGVMAACAASGPVQLRHAAEYAAYNVLFRPPVAAGGPAKAWGTIIYNFRIQRR